MMTYRDPLFVDMMMRCNRKRWYDVWWPLKADQYYNAMKYVKASLFTRFMSQYINRFSDTFDIAQNSAH